MLTVLASAVAVGALIPVYRLQELSWLWATAAAVLFVVPCVLLGWIAWHRLQHATRTPAPSRARSLIGDALSAITLSAAWTLAFGSAVWLVRPDSVSGFLREGAVWQFVWGIVIYAGLLQVARAHARAKERELAAANAELLALRTQLNPHFLFNTLHSLAQLAREDPVATQEALERFGDLMRYVLNAGRTATASVSLEEELQFVRSYLAIESLRLGDRLRVVEDIDPDALELAVPPLLLQPLLENAVRHGLAPRRQGGTIRLTARLSDTALTIEVADDGDGSEPDAWRRAKGLGLKAVARQLEASFSGAAQLSVTTRPQQGFAAHLEMPVHIPTRAHA
jgi:hypothetical protein